MAPSTAEQTVSQIKLADLQPSPTQPRQIFDEASLAELASSLKAQGVLQPLLLRVNGPDTYEVVDGERRLRAAKKAKLDTVPCIVRELTDAEVVEIQITQAVQRDGLAPLDEARAYKTLMDTHGLKLDDLVAKMGKSRSYIYHRFKLIELAPEVQEALATGALKLSFAEAFAQVADHEQQVKMLPLALKAPSLEYLNDAIISNYTLQLANAPFDPKDADLVPGCGACAKCPKRTAATPDLFDNAGKTDTCLDATCWQGKAAAHQEKVVAKVEAKGGEVLQGKEAKKVLKALGSYAGRQNYAEPNAQPQFLKKGTIAQALKGTDAKPVQVFDPAQGKVLVVYDLQQVKDQVPKALKRAEAPQERQENPAQRAKVEAAQRLQRMTLVHRNIASLRAIYLGLSKKGPGADVLQALVGLVNPEWQSVDLKERLAEAFGQKKLDIKKAAKGGAKQAVAVLAVLLMDNSDQGPGDHLFEQVVKAAGVDTKKLAKEAEASAKAAVEAADAKLAQEAAAKAGSPAQEGPTETSEEDDDEDLDGADEPAPRPKAKKKPAKKASKNKKK